MLISLKKNGFDITIQNVLLITVIILPINNNSKY